MLLNFSTLSYTNKNFNEDILGYTSKAAWVLDGATGYFNNRITNYNSEAEWYVSEWNKYFYCNIDNMGKSLKQILLEGMKEIKQKYYSIVNCENIEEATLPTATIAIIRIENNYINYYVLGDCIIAIKEKENENIKLKNTSKLIEDVKQKGLNYVYNIIDDYENKDSECIKYPRTKKSDDSTAIYLKLK